MQEKIDFVENEIVDLFQLRILRNEADAGNWQEVWHFIYFIIMSILFFILKFNFAQKLTWTEFFLPICPIIQKNQNYLLIFYEDVKS